MVVKVPLALELLRATEEQLETTWTYAAIMYLIMPEPTSAENALGISGATGGLLIMLLIYVHGGITQQHLAGRLNARLVVEFVGVALAGAVAVWLSAP
jgi:hypothetical protein